MTKRLVMTGWTGTPFGIMASYTTPLIHAYAHTHGAEFSCVNLQMAGVPASWVKVPYVLKALEQFDEVLSDHSYEGVKNDLAQAWRLVRYGGFIAGHDYSINAEKCADASHYANFGVKRAVDEFLNEHDLVLYGIAMDGYTSFAIKK